MKGVLTCTITTILHAKHSESDNCFVYKHFKFNTVMIMGIIREVNQEVNGSLATYNIDDHSGGSIEIKWWHDVTLLPLVRENTHLSPSRRTPVSHSNR